ncbi:MAG: bacteriohemerythrin [Spirochaetia bacterium]|nr:bacteriohemerythrin [Spirochaetia bacterium]
MYLEWKSSYELGIDKVDKQHMRLVALINRLDESHRDDKGRDTVETVFQGLMDYCNYHFVVEEMVMKNHGYREYDNHKIKHGLFIEKIKTYKSEYLKGDITSLLKTIDYLNSWLIEHIMVEDRQYVPVLKEKFH